MPSGVYKHKSGYKRPPMTQEQKDKISASKKLNPTKYWLGKERSDETKDKISLARKGFKHSEETLEKFKGRDSWNKGLKGYRAGEESHLWKGGITPINEQIRKSLEYKQWRKEVFERDNFTCQICGNNESGNLNADHIKPFAYYSELRFDINNGRTLCIDCHKKTDTYGHKAHKHKQIDDGV